MVEFLDTSMLYRLQILGVGSIASSKYTQYVAQTVPPGLTAFFWSIPVLIASCVAPFLFDPDKEVVCMIMVLFAWGWLSTFKVLALCMDRGPLAEHRDANSILFAIYMFLPLVPVSKLDTNDATNSGKTNDGGSNEKQSGSFGDSTVGTLVLVAWKLLLLAFCAASVASGTVNGIIKDVAYCAGIYALLGLCMDGPSTLLGKIFGVRFKTHFDNPFIAASLGELWAKRWNLVAGGALRDIVYDPVVEGCFIRGKGEAKANESRKGFAGLATFVASGLAHAVIIWVVSGQFGWKWLLFFTIQAPLIMLERTVLRPIRRASPRAVKIVMTWILFEITGHYLFVANAEETGIAAKVVASISKSVGDLFR